MNFDQRWLQFEITHGPQSPGAKEDALFWYNAGQSDMPCVETRKEDDSEEEATPADTYSDGYEDGLDFTIRRVTEFATVNEPTDPLTKENLLQFLETLR